MAAGCAPPAVDPQSQRHITRNLTTASPADSRTSALLHPELLESKGLSGAPKESLGKN